MNVGMADETGSKQLAAAGRLISILGYVMVGLGWFGGDLLRELGLNLGEISGPLVVLGFLAVAAGRGIKRRATPKSDQPDPRLPRPPVAQRPKPAVAQQPKPDVAAIPLPVKARPKPVVDPLQKERTSVARSLEHVLADMDGESVDSGMDAEVALDALESLDKPPKTSAEMLEEAKHQFDMPVEES